MSNEIIKDEEIDTSIDNEVDMPLSAELVDGKLTIKGGNKEQRELMDALATECRDYSALMLGQLLNMLVADKNIPDGVTHAIRCAVELLKGFAPRNQLEAMLAVQGVCAHMASVKLAQRTISASMIPQMEASGNLANKFMRTFTAQFEALARVRRGGEQIIKHVYVGEGGQAVFAKTINQGGRDNYGNDEQPHGTGVFEESASLPSPDEAGIGVPISGDAQRSLSPSRRVKSGSTDGK